jgi:hypothetical protein
MPKPKPEKTKADDPEEYERFVKIARELGVDESPDALDRAFGKIIRTPGTIISKPQSPKNC